MEPLIRKHQTTRLDAAWVAGGIALGLAWFNFLNQVRVEWSLNPQYQYGWGVPFLAAYLFIERWRTRPAPSADRVPAPIGWILLGLIVLLLPLRVVQEANPDWRAVSWTWAGMVVLLTLWFFWTAGGGAWARHFAVPIVFVLLAVPWPSGIETPLVQGLTRTVAAVTVEALNWIGIPATQRGNLIELTRQIVGVDEACSGVRSFQSVLMAGVFLGELFRLPAARRLLLVLAGVCAAGTLNIVRAFTLTWLCTRNGPGALEQWHDPAGWTILVLSVGLLWTGARRLGRNPGPVDSVDADPAKERNMPDESAELQMTVSIPEGRAPRVPAVEFGSGTRGTRPFDEVRSCGEARPSDLTLPSPALMCMLAGWFVIVESATRRWFQSHEASMVRRGDLAVNWPQSDPGFRFEPVPAVTRLVLRSDDIRAATWNRTDGSYWQVYYARWRPGRISTQVARVHRPEVCLPAVGLLLESDHGPARVSTDTLNLDFDRFTFRNGERPLFVFYTLWEDRVVPGQEGGVSRVGARGRIADAWFGRRHLGQELLEVAISGVPSLKEAEIGFRSFLAENVQIRGGR